MAAFSYQLHQPFHNLDSMYNSQSSQMRMSVVLDDTNTAPFPQFYQLESLLDQQVPAKPSFNGSGGYSILLGQTTKAVDPTLSNNNNDQHSLTNRTLTHDSSSVTDKLESGEQVTQNVNVPAAMDSKRKSKESPSPNSAQSKGGVGDRGRGKKQRKCNRNMKDDEEKQPKEDVKKKKVDEEAAPTGYIHVRARRGQATDSHSLAERVRREKISERMKLLQALVPGCDKVTGKALMLDEIINYVQSLQNQVEFLSMKLASLNPLFYDYGMDLDCLMARPDQILSNMASPAQNMQQCEPLDGPIIPDTSTSLRTDAAAAANSYSQLDTSAAVFFPQMISQANGQLLWDVDDQRQRLINNQTGFANNLCSFH